MTGLILASVLFVGTHFLIPSSGLRAPLAHRLGERGFALAFSILSLAWLLWMVIAFQHAPRQLLWAIPGASHLAMALMPIALLLLVGGYTAPNPTAVMQPLPGETWRPRGIMSVTRHPIMWAIGLWALLHLLGNGTAAGLVFFGSLTLLAFLGTLAIDAKKRRNWPAASWERLAASTSKLPFLAIAQGRAVLDWRGLGWLPIAIVVALYLAIVWWFHPQVIGVPLVSG